MANPAARGLQRGLRHLEGRRSQDALRRKLQIAQREKNRYFANRIAQTELARARQARVAAEFIADDTIDVLEVRINPKHPRADICDVHARANLFGLGPGCYPKARTPRPPYHSFCWCRVRSRPDLAAVGAREVPGGEAAYLRGLSSDEAGRVMGSKERAARVMDGASVEAVTNAGKDAAYRLARVGDGAALRHALGAENAGMPPHKDAVPGAGNATIHPDKLRRYVLDPSSEQGGHKARVFAAVLGFSQDNARALEFELLRGLPFVGATPRRETAFGRLFSADIPVTGPGGSGTVRTGWHIDTGADVPRLVTAYVLRG